MTASKLLFSIFIALIFSSTSGKSHAQAPGDENWHPMGGIAGLNNTVYAMITAPDGSVYCAGHFTVAGDAMVNAIARWDGTQWHALGDGVDGEVHAMALGGDGSLYVTGGFENAGGQPANNVARWDGAQWHSLDSGIDGGGRALLIGTDGKLYLGGGFSEAGGAPALNVAVWDGAVWSQVGEGFDNEVLDLAEDSAGRIYAGGGFTLSGATQVNRVAVWDGVTWANLGLGVNAAVKALTVDSLDRVFVTGSFSHAGGAPASRVAMWDGAAWSALGNGLSNAGECMRAEGGELIVAGNFTQVIGGIVEARNIAKWNGTSWTALGDGTGGTVHALTRTQVGRLWAAGTFTVTNGTSTILHISAVPAYRLAEWDGVKWTPAVPGVNGEITALIHDPATGHVFAGGHFTQIGGVQASLVAEWDGAAWSPLGAGLRHEASTNMNVQDLALDTNGNLIAVGRFTHAGALIVNSVARWDGAAWSALGDGLNNEVICVSVAADGHIYAGGNFFLQGGARLASWDGVSWSPVGGGVNNTVEDLLPDSQGGLYVTGRFTEAGSLPMARVARWNGTAWEALGTGLDSGTLGSSLAFATNGDLFLGGSFFAINGSEMNNIARWDGAAWHPLGAGVAGTVRALALDASGNLIAGGNFVAASGVQARKIARWDGGGWSVLGSGMSSTQGGDVQALAFDGASNIYVGGMFEVAGDAAAGNAARLVLGEITGPEISVEHAGLNLNSGLNTLDAGQRRINAEQTTLTLLVRNTGTDPLTGISVSLTPTLQFTLDATTLPAVLPPGGSGTISVTYAPVQLAALHITTVEIASNDADENPFRVFVSGSGTLPAEPIWVNPPLSHLAMLGEPTSFNPTLTGAAPVSFLWLRDGVPMPGRTTQSLHLSAVRATDARSYSVRAVNDAGQAESAKAWLGVIMPVPPTVQVADGGTLRLTASVRLPAGRLATYTWVKNSNLLPDEPRITGRTGPVLTLRGCSAADSGGYECIITMFVPGGTTTRTTPATAVSVLSIPIVTPPALPPVYVNQPFTATAVSTQGPVRFTAVGLPPGFRLDAATGQITGAATTARLAKNLPAPYPVRLTATNLAGTSVPMLVDWLVLPVPETMAGTYEVLVERHAGINAQGDAIEGLGGSARILITSKGTFSGTLIMSGQKIPLKGLLTPTDAVTASANASVPRKKPLPPLNLSFDLDAATGSLSGLLDDGAAFVPMEGWRATADTVLAGTHHLALLPESAVESDATFPQGSGYAIAKITTKGAVTWTGQTAEGIKITGAALTCASGFTPFHLTLDGGTASVQGWLEFAPNTASGLLSWFKAEQTVKSKTRLYRNGFPLHYLEARGGRYTPPTTGQIIFGLNNATATCAEGGLPANFAVETAIQPNHSVILSNNDAALSLKLTPKTGMFSISFTVPGAPARKATGTGLFVPGLQVGAGLFLLPASADKSSALLSGRLEISQ